MLKNLLNARDVGLIPGVGMIPGRSKASSILALENHGTEGLELTVHRLMKESDASTRLNNKIIKDLPKRSIAMLTKTNSNDSFLTFTVVSSIRHFYLYNLSQKL